MYIYAYTTTQHIHKYRGERNPGRNICSAIKKPKVIAKGPPAVVDALAKLAMFAY